MLFNLQLSNVNGALQNYTDRISELEQQLIQLREEQAQMQEHKQKLLTAEKAAESALEQVKLAVSLVGNVDTTQIEVFQDAIDQVFASHNAAPQLAYADSVSGDEVSETVTQEEAALEIHADDNTETVETARPTIDADAIAEEVTAPEVLTKEQLGLFTIKQLTNVATEYFALSETQTKACKRKDDWINLLLAQDITNADMKAALPEDFQ